MKEDNLVPPDGGWGWVIVVAYALFNFLVIPVMQNFGLIFQGTFKEIGLSPTDEGFVITSGLAIGNLAGLAYGPLIKKFSYRKVCFVSACLTSTGVISMMFAHKVLHFIISYGLVTSIGLSLGLSGYSYALNSYFLKKRSFATGFAFTITCMGSIAMPQLISFLLSEYGVSGTCLLIGGLALNSFVSAALLQPVEWHLKKDPTKRRGSFRRKPIYIVSTDRDPNQFAKKSFRKRASIYAVNIDDGWCSEVLVDETVAAEAGKKFKQSIRNFRSASLHKMNFERGHRPSEQGPPRTINDIASIEDNPKATDQPITTVPWESNLKVSKEEAVEEGDEKESALNDCFICFAQMFDLSLLKDKSFLNLLFGLSFGIFAEQSFSVLTPFILADLGMQTHQIATFISVLSLTDVIFRFVTPFVANYFKMKSRTICIISFVLLITSRSFLLLPVHRYALFIGVALSIGVAKGVRTVYWALVLPDNVPLKMLPSASGFNMVLNGVFLLVGGPLLGLAKQYTGSYVNCIFITNSVTFLALVMWSTEMLYNKIAQSKKKIRKRNQVVPS